MAKAKAKTKSTAKPKSTARKPSTKRTPKMQAAPAAAPIVPLIKPPEQHSLPLSIVLHLLPGILVTIFYVLTGPWFVAYGYPALVALLVGALLILIPFQVGVLLREARRKNGSNSLMGVVLYRAFLPWWQFVVFPLALIAWAFIASTLQLLDPIIIETLFSWLPDWYDPAAIVTGIDSFARTPLIVTLVLYVMVNVLAGPIVEELYFRGYLLPRLSRYGKWAPVINVVLFSLYHLWTPWQLVTRIVALLPMVYVVRWKKNLYIGMITHVLLNLIGFSLSIAPIILGRLQQ